MNHILPGFLSIVITASLLSVMVARPATAAENCGNLPRQAEMNACYGKALADEDRALNTTYREIGKRLAASKEATGRLLAAERAWIAYRDAECAFSASGSAGGSLYPMLIASCEAALTNRRNSDLRAYLQCTEGDLSCPVPAAR